jgi:uncharacterized UPF0146 family protein
VEAVVGYITDEYARGADLVEVGVGRRDAAARALAAVGYGVTVTDVRELSGSVGDQLRFVRDDVREPDRSVYEGAELVYSLRPPYEIHAAIAETARRAGADALLAPLGDEGVAVEAELVNRGGRAFFVRRS